MSEWNLPWEGGCRCGQVRIRVTAPPMLASACHCTGCQRMTASAFSLTLTVPAEGFEITAGEPVIGGLHGPVHHYFCPYCMSWMFTRVPGTDYFVNLRAPMLDESAWVVPFVETWTQEKLPWAATPAPHSFETAPAFADYAKLTEAYAADGARPAP
jgi:hypothetical protein